MTVLGKEDSTETSFKKLCDKVDTLCATETSTGSVISQNATIVT